ncbi:MAG TPA: RtcB family protein, partial [Vicinamibacteria bacterium]|nr:RtcB family protein [Vicinamibacteria bacterium]
MSDRREAVVSRWLVEPLSPEVQAALERVARSEDVRRVAVMPDVHLSADVCVGTVVATGHTLYPNAVGGDIGCGVAGLRFLGEAAVLEDERLAAAVLAGLYDTIPTLSHRRGQEPVMPRELSERRLSSPALEAVKEGHALLQLGTLGRGNHFVELQADEEGNLWLMLHSGSRSIGQAIRDHHLARSTEGRQGLRHLDVESPEGRDYLGDLQWALDYAAASRRAMVDAVCQVVAHTLALAADEASFVSCHHNHVRREEHLGEILWV